MAEGLKACKMKLKIRHNSTMKSTKICHMYFHPTFSRPLWLLAALLACFSFLAASCSKSLTATAPTATAPFHGQVYKSLDGTTVLTLISIDECELSENSPIILCKYTTANGTIRVVRTALGTTEVIYFRLTPQGLEENNGNVLLSPESYADAVSKIQRQKEEIENEAKAEEQRISHVKEVSENSRRITKTIATFPLNNIFEIDDPRGGVMLDSSGNIKWVATKGNITITDVSLAVYLPEMNYNRVEGFQKLASVQDVVVGPKDSFFVFSTFDGALVWDTKLQFRSGEFWDTKLHFRSNGDAVAAHDALVAALNGWRSTFHEIAVEFPKTGEHHAGGMPN